MQPPAPPKRVILFLAANPRDTSALRLADEQRSIQQAQRGGKSRDDFHFQSRTALQVEDLRQALIEERPEIVHFAGHGTGRNGIAAEDADGFARLIPTDALANLFALCKAHVRCVILNACLTQVQAIEIAKHIPCVIGLSNNIGDDPANEFTKGFYDALLSGLEYGEAFNFGVNAIQLKNLPDDTLYLMIQQGNRITGSLAAWQTDKGRPPEKDHQSPYLASIALLGIGLLAGSLLTSLGLPPSTRGPVRIEQPADRVAKRAREMLAVKDGPFTVTVLVEAKNDEGKELLGEMIVTDCQVHDIKVTTEAADKGPPRYHLRLNTKLTFKLAAAPHSGSKIFDKDNSQSVTISPHLIVDDTGVIVQSSDTVEPTDRARHMIRSFPELRLQHEGTKQFFVQKLGKPWLIAQ